MSLALVVTRERPDLAEVTGRWRWDAFASQRRRPLDGVLRAERETACGTGLVPRTMVLLASGAPIDMASLAALDLEGRPDCPPWLAGVFVVPAARGRGHAARLVRAVEDLAAEAGFARLRLHTRHAERVYARIGWRTVERFRRDRAAYALVRRDLAVPGG